jgi:histidine triad (HIT) family protein
MTKDFYCEEVLNGKTPVEKVYETERVLAYYHTRPYYEVHIVVIPKKHISSLLTLEENDTDLLIEILDVVKIVAAQVVAQYGASRILTNLGNYQDSKHLHWHVFYGKQIQS